MVITFTYIPITQFGENRCTQFRVIMVTDPPPHTHTNTATNPQTGLITKHCAAKLSVQCKKYIDVAFPNELVQLFLTNIIIISSSLQMHC